MHLDRVVPVIRFAAGQRRVGSGYRICGTFVLTAAHCVRGSGLRVWLPDGERNARVVADGAPDVDLALVEITPASGQAPVAGVTRTRCARVDRSTPGRICDCIAIGYPKHVERPDAVFTTGEVDGWIPAGSGLSDTSDGRTEGFLTLKAEGTAPRPSLPVGEGKLAGSVWAGMSGAAVFAGDLLVGVVAEHHLPEGDGSLTVVPIEWAERLVGADRVPLLRALGVESAAGMELLTAGAQGRRWASLLPDRPAVLADRPEVRVALQLALLTSAGRPVLVAGMGGSGKSVLAAEIARTVLDGRDAELATAYPAGVAWVTVGRERAVTDIQLELARWFGEEQPGLTGDWQTNRARLRQLAVGRSGLLVLDDVWTQDRYEPFRLDASGVQILITTRNQELADELGGVQVQVGELEPDQSRCLLAATVGLPEGELPGEADQLLLEVGHLALGVAMVGAMAREHGQRSWPDLLTRLQKRQLGKIAHKFADYQYSTLLRAIDVAVDDLDAADQPRWSELAVFAGQGGIPERAIAALWQSFDDDGLDTGDRISRFLARSLLQSAGDGRYRLHDLQDDVALLRLGADLGNAHARLVDGYAGCVANVAGTSRQGWTALVAALARRPAADRAWQVADDGYLLGHLVYHLRNGGLEQEAAAMLVDYDWITVGLARRGLVGLASDYDGLPGGSPLRLVRDALNRSWRALADNLGCLPDQLFGRLAEEQDPVLGPLLDRVQNEQRRRPLQIIRSGLQRPSGSLLYVLTGHRGRVVTVALTGDGTRAITGSDDGTAIVWDLGTGTALRTLTGHERPVNAVAVTGDGAWVVTGSDDQTAIVWNLASGERRYTLVGHKEWVTAVAVTRDGAKAITVSPGRAIVWDLANGEQLHTLVGQWLKIAAVAVTRDGTRLVTGSDDRTAIVWDLLTGERLHTLAGHQREVTAAVFTGDDAKVVTGSYDKTAIVWDALTGEQLYTLAGHQDWIRALAVSDDGVLAVTGSNDRTAMVWDLVTGERRHTLSGHQEWIWAVAVSGDGALAVTASADNTAMVWDLAIGEQLNTLVGHQDQVEAVTVTSDGALAVTASHDETAIVWDLASSQPKHPIVRHKTAIRTLAVAGDGAVAVTGSYDGAAMVWDLVTGERRHTLSGHRGWVSAVAVSGDGDMAVTASYDDTAMVWDLLTGERRHTLVGHKNRVGAVTVTSDRAFAVTGSRDRTAIVWDLATGERLRTLTGHPGAVEAVAVTRDGALAVTAGEGGIAMVWDLATGERLHTLVGQIDIRTMSVVGAWAVTASFVGGTAMVWDLATGERLRTLTDNQQWTAVAVSGDGTLALTASDDTTAVVWDLVTGRRRHSLVGHKKPIHAMAVTADGTWAVTTSQDGTAIVWDLHAWPAHRDVAR